MRTVSPRAAARRNVLTHLNTAREQIKTLRQWWTAETTVYVDPADRAPGDNTYRRDRRPDEYPEAQRRYWRATITRIDDLITHLTALRAYCVEQHNETEG